MRALLLSCADPGEKQFAGLLRLMSRLQAELPGLACRQWQGRSVRCRWRRRLAAVLIAGHGSSDRAAFRSPAGCLTPESLRLPPQASLYLLGCYQGKPDLRKAWAAGAGLAEERVHGHDRETESALSTCLLLHLLEDGLGSLGSWFEAWRRCNAELEEYFPRLREAYAECAADPLRAWEKVRGLQAVEAHRDFFASGLRHPEYLTGLA